MNFFGGVGRLTSSKPFDFGEDPNHDCSHELSTDFLSLPGRGNCKNSARSAALVQTAVKAADPRRSLCSLTASNCVETLHKAINKFNKIVKCTLHVS